MAASNSGDSATVRVLDGYVRPKTVYANENDRFDDAAIAVGGSTTFWVAKRALDMLIALAAMPFVALVGLILIAINPLFNPGPLLYSQLRIGRHNRPFTIIKFRTMSDRGGRSSTAFASAEADRIPKFGAVMRRFRIDELPQMYNVLCGEMSVIGPRPEQLDFVKTFAKSIPGYAMRHAVRPGISGYAQVTNGYADCEDTTKEKLEKDLEYIRRAGWKMESYILVRTVWVVLTGFGAL